MLYQKSSFTVPASGDRKPEDCDHSWVDKKRNRCVLCGVAMLHFEPVGEYAAVLVNPNREPAPFVGKLLPRDESEEKV